MKKTVLLLLVVFVFVQGISAQRKQIKELLLQIEALQVHIEYAKQGYSAVKKGLDFIGDVKKGEVNLHGSYFDYLKIVNPKVRNYYKVAAIVSMQIKIIKNCKRTFNNISQNELFHGDELDYIQRFFNSLLDECDKTLDCLLAVALDSRFEMKDDQRIKRIDELYKDMLDNYEFCRTFGNEVLQLSLSKSHENNDVKLMQRVNAL